MCGIAGIVDPALPRAEIRRLLQQMAQSLWHRGPDEGGFFAADGVGLAIRRLSIIDVAGGHQPATNEDKQVQVVLNGEIYNYPELRQWLIARGHDFRNSSDTEVIAHLYEEMDSECVSALRGMFGIALWDQRRNRLLLARDRLGKKPLFYFQRDQRLVFGSEIKAILAAVPETGVPDMNSVVPYFRQGFVCEPRTAFRGVWKLPAASSLSFENGAIALRKYWRLTFEEEQPGAVRSHSQLVEELDALLAESVRMRLMSEVPLGVFLSGGLDSSTVVAYAHRAGLRPLKTFTIGFDRPESDESADAEIVARHFQTEHHVLRLSEEELKGNLPETILTMVRHFDEPFGDSSALPTYYVSKLARQYVTVILSGDGGDELFFGYSAFRGIRFSELYQRLPAALSDQLLPALARTAAKFLPAGHRYGALRAAKVLEDSLLPFAAMCSSKDALCSEAQLSALFTKEFTEHVGPFGAPDYPVDVVAMMHSKFPALVKAGYLSLRHRLLEDMLVKVDRMSMAHSLEVRSPLLDHRLVEFAASLPASLKLRGWETKAILRDTVRRYLPYATLRKRKQGFCLPLRHWLRRNLFEMVSDYLSPAHGHLPAGVFRHATIQRLLSEHRKGEADHSSIIWLLLNYAAWNNLYNGAGAQPSSCAPAQRQAAMVN